MRVLSIVLKEELSFKNGILKSIEKLVLKTIFEVLEIEFCEK